MAAVPEVDVAAIIAPIPGENPGGPRMPFMVRQKLEAARKEFEPHPDDPAAAPIPKKPEWAFIVKTASDTLANTSKDLETSLRLLEALTRIGGFPGLTAGFGVVKSLIDHCWDYLHPIPDPQDGEGPEIRAERFNWIGDQDAGANFPNTVRLIPFLRANGQICSMQDRRDSMENKGTINSDDMSRATLASDTTAAEIEASHQAFFDLDRALTERLNNNAPGMVGLRQALEEIYDLSKRMAGGTAAADSPAAAGGAGSSAGGASSGGMPGAVQVNLSSVSSREEAYRVIGQVADALERIEPHSPIPDLLRRAVELGRMPFRRLIKELVADGGSLTQIYREFGIKDDGGS
ncbi:MAG: type VI secretion system protein TssA [Planctomycetota bacterium]